MKVLKLGAWIILSLSLFIVVACGGGGGGSVGFGEVSMDITDAKPLLPEGTTNLWVTITEVLAHKSGGGWMSLPLPESPYTIDLLFFSDGFTTELVPPVSLESGKYTQIRLVVSHADISFDNGDTLIPVEIPPGHLKTDKNFTFEIVGGGAVDLTVDFDLSQSIVVTGPSETPSYKLKPVLHIVDTFEAAAIAGSIDNTLFISDFDAIVTVFVLNPDNGLYEEYTKLVVSQSDTSPTEFSIYWLAPNKNYKVEINFGSPSGPEYTEDIDPNDPNIGPGGIYPLNLIGCSSYANQADCEANPRCDWVVSGDPADPGHCENAL